MKNNFVEANMLRSLFLIRGDIFACGRTTRGSQYILGNWAWIHLPMAEKYDCANNQGKCKLDHAQITRSGYDERNEVLCTCFKQSDPNNESKTDF